MNCGKQTSKWASYCIYMIVLDEHLFVESCFSLSWFESLWLFVIDCLFYSFTQADFVPLPNCSLTTQYDYASDHGIKLLVVITEAGLLQTNSVEVNLYEIRHKMTAYFHQNVNNSTAKSSENSCRKNSVSCSHLQVSHCFLPSCAAAWTFYNTCNLYVYDVIYTFNKTSRYLLIAKKTIEFTCAGPSSWS